MKKILILLYMLVNCATSVAQFTQIQTNTTDQLINITKIGSTQLVSTFYNYAFISNDNFDTYQTITLPCSITYGIKIFQYIDSALFLMSSTISPSRFEFWKSIDTGKNWVLLYDTLNVAGIDFEMFNSNDGLLYSSQYRKFRTNDGGHSWQLESSIMYSPTQILMYNDSIGVAPYNEKVIFTNNRFISENVSNCYNIQNVNGAQFLNKDTIIFTSCGNGIGCFLLLTQNNGISWQVIPIFEFEPAGIHFFDYNEGYVVGRGYILGSAPLQGMIKKTTDMGATWTTYTTNIDCKFLDIKFLNDSIALITGDNGTLIKWNKNSKLTSVINIGKYESIKIFPNPATTQHTLTIQSKQYDKQAVCTMYDYSGRSIAQYTIKPNGDNTYKLVNDISKLANGMYYYKVQLGVEEYMIKFVITH